nr:hypothetical protein [bacterium]
MKRSFNFMSVFIVFAIFLLNFQVIMATDGAGGSGKPVVIKLRKDYFEERIKMDMQDKIDENPVTAEIPVGPLSFTANLKMSIKNVLFSRGLMAEGLSNLGNENALRYRVLIFGSVEIESITGSVSNDILDSYKKYYNQLLMSYRYKIKASDMEFYGNDKILEYMDTPNFILKGYYRPVTDEAGRLNEDTYILEFEDFQINDLNNTTAIEGMVLNKFKEFESESIFSIEGMNDELEGRNPFLKISMPGIFETESTMIGMDHCDVNGMNCIEYPIPDPPEESFSNNKPDSLVEMRISEDVLYKTIQDEFEAEIVSPMELEELNVNIMNGYLHIQFKLSMKIVLVNCHLMEFNYYYKFDPSTGMPGEDNETGISLKLESHDKNIGSVTPPSLIAFGVCAGAANEIEERFLDKTDTISDGLTENIPTLIDLAKEINMKDYEIEAGFEVGNNFRDVVLSLIKPVPEKEKYIYNFNWAFSDDNENGIQNINDRCWYADWINGEDCDIDGDGIKDHVDQKAYKAESTVNPSEIDGAQYDENCIEMTGGNFHIKNCDFEKDVHYGEYFDLEGSLYMKNGTVSDKPSAYLSSFYCYCGKDNDRRKDCSTGGTCGQHHGNPGELSNSFYGKNTWQPMYDGISSGRDNRFYEKDKYDKKISLATGVYAKKTYGKWQWQKDLADVYGVFKLPEWDMKKIYQTTGRKYNEKDYHLFYLRDFNASRTSFAPSRNKFNSGNNYIITKNAGTANETKELNPKYFENYFVSGNNTFNTMQQAATNSKWSNSMPFYLYMIKWKDRVASRSIDIDGYWIYYPYEWLNDFLNPWLIDKTGPVENGGMPLTTNPGYIFDTVLTPDTMLLQKVYTNKNSQQTFKSPQGYLSYSFEDGKYIISPAVSSAYESEGKEVLRGVDLKGASFINYNGSIFAAGNLISRTQMKSAYSEDIDTVYDDYSYNNIFVKINEDGENYELRPLAY